MRSCDFCHSSIKVSEIGLSIREICETQSWGQLLYLSYPSPREEGAKTENKKAELVGDICSECLSDLRPGFAGLQAFAAWVRSRGT